MMQSKCKHCLLFLALLLSVKVRCPAGGQLQAAGVPPQLPSHLLGSLQRSVQVQKGTGKEALLCAPLSPAVFLGTWVVIMPRLSSPISYISSLEVSVLRYLIK